MRDDGARVDSNVLSDEVQIYAIRVERGEGVDARDGLLILWWQLGSIDGNASQIAGVQHLGVVTGKAAGLRADFRVVRVVWVYLVLGGDGWLKVTCGDGNIFDIPAGEVASVGADTVVTAFEFRFES